jgi:hypothetical protein
VHEVEVIEFVAGRAVGLSKVQPFSSISQLTTDTSISFPDP